MHPHPPRREPRVLCITFGRRRLAWAAADPWEVRGAGVVRTTAKRLPLALLRVGRREKPTAFVALDGRVLAAATHTARRLCIPLVRDRPPSLPIMAASDLYPELRIRAPTRALQILAAIAVSAVLHSEPAPRRYVHLADHDAPDRPRA